MSQEKRDQLVRDGLLDPATGLRRNPVAEQEAGDWLGRVEEAKARGADEAELRELLGFQPPHVLEMNLIEPTDEDRAKWDEFLATIGVVISAPYGIGDKGGRDNVITPPPFGIGTSN